MSETAPPAPVPDGGAQERSDADGLPTQDVDDQGGSSSAEGQGTTERARANASSGSALPTGLTEMLSKSSRRLEEVMRASRVIETARARLEVATRRLDQTALVGDAVSKLLADQRLIAEQTTRAIAAASLGNLRERQAHLFENFTATTQLRATAEQLQRNLADIPVPRWFDIGAFPDVVRRLHELHARYWPPNWADHDIDPAAAWDLAAQDGLLLVWVPRGAIAVAVLAAPDTQQRYQLLLEHGDDVLDDCESVIHAVVHTSLEDHRSMASDAIRAYRQGLHRPAQAAAAVVFTDLAQHVFAAGKLSRLSRTPLRVRDRDEIALIELRVALVVESAIRAIDQVGEHIPEDQWPERFNRNLSAHRVSSRQYTAVHALVAVMVAVALLREAQALLEDGILKYSDGEVDAG